jgi:transcriptional antiterminator RfaH
MHWYVVHTKPRQEMRALTNLELQGYDCFLPTLPKKKILKKSVEITQEPLFPRYMFISLDVSIQGKSWSPIRSTLGVSKLITFGDDPVKVDAELIHALRTCNDIVQKAPSPYKPGDFVQMKEGAFAGLDLIYQMDDGESRAHVMIEILHKQTRFSVPLTDLKKSA